MGKRTGFLDWRRQDPPKRLIRERLGDWRELYLKRPEEESRRQGGRCMDCGVPFCQQGCPLGNLIPDWNDLVYRDRWKDAIVALHSTNNFPEFTGRLCPAPCEAACVLAINDDAVTIEQIEREIVERAFAEGWIQPQPPPRRTGRRVAVIGSGPCGLAAATQLNRAGHEAVVFEKADRLGGLLRYGIPDFKMEKWVIDRRLELMEAEGVRFVTGTEAGVDISWAEIADQFDAVLIAVGAGRPRDLHVPGRELDGVHFAMDFLTQQNRRNAGDPDPERGQPSILATDKRVVILGGGDTGSDCLGTALRQGARDVLQVELLPPPPEERSADNPWPQWPNVWRTSSSQAEGGIRDFAMMTKTLRGDGRVEQLEAVRVDLVTSTNGGGPKLVERPGTETVIEVDLVLLAMGFLGPNAQTLVDQIGVDLDRRSNVAVDGQFRTSQPGVYAAGDAHRGASLIVWAIAEGREAARCIDGDLRDGRPLLPTRGADYHFGGR